MSVDRQSIANDLNAIANAVTRKENLYSIVQEVAIVIENMEELADQEAGDAELKKANNTHHEELKGCGS